MVGCLSYVFWPIWISLESMKDLHIWRGFEKGLGAFKSKRVPKSDLSVHPFALGLEVWSSEDQNLLLLEFVSS